MFGVSIVYQTAQFSLEQQFVNYLRHSPFLFVKCNQIVEDQVGKTSSFFTQRQSFLWYSEQNKNVKVARESRKIECAGEKYYYKSNVFQTRKTQSTWTVFDLGALQLDAKKRRVQTLHH